MTSKGFKNRKRFSTTLDKDLVPCLDELHLKTRIPRARLLDEAIEDLMVKYDIEVKR